MAITVKKVVLWRRMLANKPGTLSAALKPFADSKVNLKVAMGYVFPNDKKKAALEVYPVETATAKKAGKKAGLSPAKQVHCLLVEGDDKAGVGHQIAEALSSADLNMQFAIMQSVNKRFTAVLGFDTAKKADGALKVVKAATKTSASRRKPAAKKTAARKTTAKRSTSKKSTAKKTAAKKPATRKKPAARKSTARKSTKKRTSRKR